MSLLFPESLRDCNTAKINEEIKCVFCILQFNTLLCLWYNEAVTFFRPRAGLEWPINFSPHNKNPLLQK